MNLAIRDVIGAVRVDLSLESRRPYADSEARTQPCFYTAFRTRPEAIYQAIYDPDVPVTRPAKRRRRYRRCRVQGLQRRSRLTAMTIIADRPPEVEERLQGGNLHYVNRSPSAPARQCSSATRILRGSCCLWQRGSNENMIGLPREYFPKGTDLRGLPHVELQRVAEEVNTRPPQEPRLGAAS